MAFMRTTGESSLDHCDWVIWDLEVRDPQRCAPEGVAEATGEPIRALAASLGCTLLACVDDDSYGLVPEGTYYSWLVRVPRGEHRDDHGIPVAVARIQQRLRALLPSQLQDWHIAPDRGLTLREAAGAALHDAYSDALRPFEAALMPLRVDGAERLEPRAEVWASDEATAAGTYALWLCEDPAGHAWLVLYVGLAITGAFWQSRLGTGLREREIDAEIPVLVTPRPAEPRWMASLRTTGFTKNRVPPDCPAAHMPGARHQWTANDASALADRVCRDLQALFPKISRLR